MGKQITIDDDVVHLLEGNKKVLEEKKIYQVTWTNAIRLLATQEPKDVRIKEKYEKKR